MKTKVEVLKLLHENRSRLSDFGVREIGLFGSVARDEQHKSSDIDILIDLNHNTFDSYMSVLLFLEDLFDSRVDLVLK